MGSHDQLFKALLERFLGDLLHLVVPRLARRLAPERRRVLPNEGFTDSPRGEQRLLDLVAEVPMEGPRSAGEAESVVVHVEVERRARSGMGPRMLEYSRVLALRHGGPVLSIVLYLAGGPVGVTRSTFTEGLEGEAFQVFHHFELGVSSSDAVPYLEMDLPLAWALASLARRPPAWSRVRHKLECLARIAGVRTLDPAARSLLTYCVETYLELDDAETEELKMLAEREERRDVLEILDSGMTWGDRLLAKGRKEGLEKGLEQGRVCGMQETILRQLEQRFGPLPEPARERVESTTSSGRLEEIADRLLSAESLADLGLL